MGAPSTAFETQIERTSAGGFTRGSVTTGNGVTRPTSAYPVNGFRKSQDRMHYDYSMGQSKAAPVHHSQIKYN
jgi:hypothetical protein